MRRPKPADAPPPYHEASRPLKKGALLTPGGAPFSYGAPLFISMETGTQSLPRRPT